MSRRTWGIDERVRKYLLDHSLREPDVLAELRAATAKLPSAGMQISPEQGQLMALLVQAIGAKRAIEIGTFTGYSALWVALALPLDGELGCCDVSEEWTAIGRGFWAKARVAHKIDLRIAPAVATLDRLLAGGEAGAYDFAFIDADKTGYDAYYERCLELLRRGGLIAIDNVLWGGSVADPTKRSADPLAVRALTRTIHRDERVALSMLPVGDGVTLVLKRGRALLVGRLAETAWIQLASVAHRGSERARTSAGRRPEELEPRAVAPVDAALGDHPVHRDVVGLRVDRVEMGELVRHADDGRRARCRRKSAVEEPAAVAEAIAPVVEPEHREQYRVRLHFAATDRVGDVVDAVLEPHAGVPLPEEERRLRRDHDRQRRRGAAVAQAPGEEACVVLVLVRPAKCNDPAREVREPALQMAVDRLAMFQDCQPRQCDSLGEEARAQLAAPGPHFVWCHLCQIPGTSPRDGETRSLVCYAA